MSDEPAAGRRAAGPSSRAPAGGVEQAAFQQAEVVPGEAAALSGEQLYYEEDGPLIHDWGPGGGAGCNFCGQRTPGCGPFGYGCFSGLYVRGEYLGWGTRGMEVPALVTSSPQGTPQANAGVLGENGTVILFGGETFASDLRSGGRLTVGWWFDPCGRLGIEADSFALGDETTDFLGTSDGTTILARPFFDVFQGFESASLVGFPGLISGSVGAEHVTSFNGSGVRALYNLCCGDGCGTSVLTHCPVHTGFRYDLLVGYRYVRLGDRLAIVEDSTSLDAQAPGAFLIRDLFDTENDFHGVDFGTTLSFCKGCWSLDVLSKVAFGNTHSVTTIDGSTVITENNQSTTFTGGLLAQRTNIGTFENDEFAVVPELGVTVGYQVNPCWRVTFGYSFIYWSKVARAGDQVDRDLNPNLLPPEDPVATTHLRPEFDFRYTDFWAQGMNAGLEGRW